MKPITVLALTAVFCTAIASAAAAQSAPAPAAPAELDRTMLPIAEPSYPHSNVLDIRNAPPAPPRFQAKAPTGAPNVLIVLIDDMGFGQSSAFGGPLQMPTVEHLAQSGLRYNQFHTTALCSPTRAALLSGRNHHSTNTGSIMETSTAYPGNTGQRPENVAPLAAMLRYNGYTTAHFGKNHETAAGRFGGWSLYLKDGKPAYTYNFLGLERHTVAATQPIAAGKAAIRFEFNYDGGGLGKGGIGTIYVNDQKVAEGRIERTQPMIFSADEGADVAEDGETPVAEDYGIPAPYKFTGKIARVKIDVGELKIPDKTAADKAAAEAAGQKAVSD